MLSCVLFAGGALAQKGGVTIIDPKEAGEDYAMQGEFSGEVDGQKMGARVIALGKEGFACVAYVGGLPGDGCFGYARRWCLSRSR